MMNQFLIESIYIERISSLKIKFGKIWQEQEKQKFEAMSRQNGEKRKFGGKERGNHRNEWKFI